MLISVPIKSTICQLCIVGAGIDAMFTTVGGQKVAKVDNSQVMALQNFLASPPLVHNHPVEADTDVAAAVDAWGAKNAMLAALPAAPLNGSDPYAATRVRWQSELAALATRVANTGDGLFI